MLALSENDVHLEGDETQYIQANDNGSGIEYSMFDKKYKVVVSVCSRSMGIFEVWIYTLQVTILLPQSRCNGFGACRSEIFCPQDKGKN